MLKFFIFIFIINISEIVLISGEPPIQPYGDYDKPYQPKYPQNSKYEESDESPVQPFNEYEKPYQPRYSQRPTPYPPVAPKPVTTSTTTEAPENCQGGKCYPTQTNSTICGPNAIYDTCPPPYPPLRCNIPEPLVACGPNPEPGDPSCVPGCRCEQYYYLNSTGACITREECLAQTMATKCRPNSPSYSTCINGGCGMWRCTDTGYVCLMVVPCQAGCSCQDSYVRSPSGICKPAAPCPPVSCSTTTTTTPAPKPVPYSPYKYYNKP